jgi:3-methylcrotonyl-CoA carboxylase alpha subunit
MPDSGKLLHLKLPPLSDTVRVDAGFVVGDEVSAHYDPMIAKLIVRGPDRHSALQKLRAALESYEIGGPVTNIEFLKRLCVSPAFVAGVLETGYIDKNCDELFKKAAIPLEVYAQTAIGLLIKERIAIGSLVPDGIDPSSLGNAYQARSWSLAELPLDGQTTVRPISVEVLEHSPDRVTVRIGRESFDVILDPAPNPNSFTSYFPSTRLETTMVRDEDKITVWQQGQQYRFQLVAPTWIEKALGVKDVTNSVRAPMPCKVLQVDVKVGDKVKKDQIIAKVESMKMEMTIRSPSDGVISKVVHQPGVGSPHPKENCSLLTNVVQDMCKAGTPLVEFEDS